MRYLLVLFIPLQLFGQSSFIRTYGHVKEIAFTSMDTLSDKGYIVGGTVFEIGTGSVDIVLLRLDENGDTLWSRTYGGVGYDYPACVKETGDRGYIIAGRTQSFGSGQDDAYVVKTDSLGNVEWSRAIGGAFMDIASWVQQTNDGGYIVTGGTTSFAVNWDDVWLIKLDSIGTVEWSKTFGGLVEESGHRVIETLDNGYLVVGATGFPSGAFIIKADSLGTMEWDRTFYGSAFDWLNAVIQCSDTGYIFLGSTQSFSSQGQDEMFLLRTDSNGDTLWAKAYGDTVFGDLRPFSMAQMMDGGFAIAASRVNAVNIWQPVLIRTDSVGSVMWSKAFEISNMGIPQQIHRNNDGGIVIGAAYVDTATWNYSSLLMKTDSLGNGTCLEIPAPIVSTNVSFTIGGGSSTSSGDISVIATTVSSNLVVNTDIVCYTGPLTLTASSTATTCNSTCDGVAVATSFGGIPPYTYLWDDPLVQTDSSATGLCAGFYNVTIVDAVNDTVIASINIPQPSALLPNEVVNNESCFGVCDGQVNTAASGGTPPYEYLWSNGDTTSNVVGLCPSTYILTITDSNACTRVDTFTISGAGPLSIDSIGTIPETCYNLCDGKAWVGYSGGTAPVAFNWTGNASTDSVANNLCIGMDTLTITDANGCVVDTIVDVTGPPEILITSIPNDSLICFGSAVVWEVTGTGGTGPLTCTWTNCPVPSGCGPDTLTPPSFPPCCKVYLEDSLGCQSALDSICTTFLPPLGITPSPNQTVCKGDSIILSTTVTGGLGGPYSYLWMPDSLFGNPVIVLPDSSQDSIVYIVYGMDGCSSPITDTIVIYTFPCVGMKESLTGKSVWVYPNPTAGRVTIEALNQVQGNVVVLDMMGRQVTHYELTTPNYELDLRSLPNGVYFIRVGEDTEKVVLSK